MLGIGAERPAMGVHLVRLFDPTSQAPPGLSKADCLEVFFRYALKTLLSKSLFRVKPVVQVYGGSGLAQALGGYQDSVLRQALMRAGASRVEACR
jgi:hypothetical protein